MPALNFTLIIYMSIGLFWAMLFIQSGLDKIVDWKGNLAWLTGHFEKSILAGLVKPMLGTLALVELVAGLTSLVGAIQVFLSGNTYLLTIGVMLSILSLLMLFFGQRLAKDYEGAKTIAIYFGVAILCCLTLLKG